MGRGGGGVGHIPTLFSFEGKHSIYSTIIVVAPLLSYIILLSYYLVTCHLSLVTYPYSILD